MEEIKLTWEEYQKRIQQVREAVIEDLNAVDPENTILKVRLWCRDEEDRFDLVCFEDFSPYMDGLYKRFNPDVVNLIRHDYEVLKDGIIHKITGKNDKKDTDQKYIQMNSYVKNIMLQLRNTLKLKVK